MITERRKNFRVQRSCRIAYRTRGTIQCYSGTIARDLSEEGVRMPLFQKMSPGTNLELEIYPTADGAAIPAQGQVVWISPSRRSSAPYVCGVEIVRISPKQRNRLVHLLLETLCNQ